MSEPTPASFGDNKDTWRTATLVTGFALLISMAAHFGGPSSATASDAPINELARTQAQAAQSLSVGGFTTIDNQPAFVILNAQGQRIGALPMNATPTAAPREETAEK